jgi:hypothetical protein
MEAINMWYIASEENTMYLAHYGTKGQRWGRRRYQNEDGSLTPEGRARYGTRENFERAQRRKKIAIGAAIGAGTALAIGGGIAIASNTKKAKAMRQFKKGIAGWDNDKLNRVSGTLTAMAKKDLESGKKFKDVKDLKRDNDAITRELAKRARREARFNNAGKEAIKKIFTETGDNKENAGSLFGKSMVKKIATAGGATVGAGLVGAGAAYLAGRTEGTEKSKKQKRDRYSSYMWQNPNKK